MPILITVRTNSTRLKQKALKELSTPKLKTIEYLIERVLTSKYANEVILCTSMNKDDDILVDIAKKYNIYWFRGDEKDKLLRWYQAATWYHTKNCSNFPIINIDGDDLFTNIELVDKAYEMLESNKTIDVIQGDHTQLICGALTYGFNYDALERVIKLKDDDDTEMMWVYFTKTGLFNVCKIEDFCSTKYLRKDIRMTLDYHEDLLFFNEILSKCESKYHSFSFDNILNIINENEYIKHINIHKQNEYEVNQEKHTHIKVKNEKKFIGNEKKYVLELIDSQKLSCTSGNWTKTLETKFSKIHECTYGVAFNSGTSTMHAALLSLDVKPGDEVISPALTVIMNTSTTIHCHAIPVYVDIDPNTFNIDPKKLEEKITKKTKAIFIVNVYGLPCDYDEILRIANKYNIPIIEDNAECILSTYKGKKVGSIGTISSFSFENSKHISCGEGGMITTNIEYLAKKCRKIGCHGFKSLEANNGAVKSNKDVWQHPNFERHDEIGWNYRLPEINSALAYAQLERVNDILELRIKSANIFLDVLKDCSYLIPQKTNFDDRVHSFWALGVKYYGDKEIGVSWYDFRQKYIEFGGDGFYGAWKVPYMEPVIKNNNFKKINEYIYETCNYHEGLCPIAEEVQKRLMVFKTNYRNLDLARYKAYCLKQTINFFCNK